MRKRYVLLVAEAPLSPTEMKNLKGVIEKRFPSLKFIAIENHPRAIIVRGDPATTGALREGGPLIVNGIKLASRLTSGAIGKLKKRAAEADL